MGSDRNEGDTINGLKIEKIHTQPPICSTK